MNVTLYVVNGSHPCATVERALQLKGLPYKLVEFPPPMHMAAMKLLFGKRTVPAMKVDDEKISGSRAILRRLDELQPEPALLPADDAARAKVEEAEAWGDDVLQPLVRRVLWPTFKAHPEAMATYSEGSKLPPIPVPVLKLIAPVATRIEMKANEASPDTYPADLRTLPELLDRVDAWIADGTLGGETPNAADLQITPSLRLLMTLGDLRPLIEARPAGQLALRVFPDFPGDAPAGIIPAEYLPAAA
ncbi:MAG: glutathione S-transferase [Solirubrobacteraceae bacterium]|jgi:glutathione S-transferase|nr:glutathione S-transferase [Solirubrobacteraceae bacterium]